MNDINKLKLLLLQYQDNQLHLWEFERECRHYLQLTAQGTDYVDELQDYLDTQEQDNE